MEALWRWIGAIRATFQRLAASPLRPTTPVPDVSDKTGAESAVADDQAAAEAEVVQATQVSVVSNNSPDQQEIQRRRELVRALFNDFGSVATTSQ